MTIQNGKRGKCKIENCPPEADPPLEEKFIHTSYFLIHIIRIIRKFGRIRIIRITVFIRVIIRYIRTHSRHSHYGF